MPEIARNRDVVTFHKGDAFTVAVDNAMAVGGWKGGQCVKYTTGPANTPTVTYSDGLVCGFLLWGSDEVSDKFTSMTGNQPAYKYAVIGAGGWLVSIAPTGYEQYTYQSRTGGGPLVPIVYHASDRLVVSLRGLISSQDEWVLSGDPRAPNNYYIAFVVQAPSPAWGNYMTVQISI